MLSTADSDAAWRKLQADLRTGRLVRMNLDWRLAFRVAVQLSERHSLFLATRSLDLLHVASARVLRLSTFASFDARQRNLAQTLSLDVTL